MSHIFISYAHADGSYARKLANYLVANGFDVWIDDRIDFGSRWVHSIFEAVDTCDAFIVIMTPHAFESKFVEKEYLRADNQKKPTFPLLLDGEAFPYFGAIQYYDVRGEKLPDKLFLERLGRFARPHSSGGQDVTAIPEQSSPKLQTREIKKRKPNGAASLRRTRIIIGLAALILVFVAGVCVFGLYTFYIRDLIFPATTVTKVAQIIDTHLPTSQAPTPGNSEGITTQPRVSPSNTPTATLTLTSTPSKTPTATPTLYVAPTIAPPLAVTPFGGGSGQIAFTRTAADRDIYLINVDGSQASNLSQNSANDGSPAWSPDGRQLLFSTDRDGNFEIYVMLPEGTYSDGSRQRRLTNTSQNDGFPAWSPDGLKIAFETRINPNDPANKNHRIRLENVSDGTFSDLPLVPPDAEDIQYPAWSPDGRRIAFVSKRSDGKEVWGMDANGSNGSNLTYTPANYGNPAWSPDGTRIAFSADLNGSYGLYVLDITSGSLPTLIAPDAKPISAPSWSPDGMHIAFGSSSVGIAIVDADGRNRRVLTTNTTDDYPAWRP